MDLKKTKTRIPKNKQMSTKNQNKKNLKVFDCIDRCPAAI